MNQHRRTKKYKQSKQQLLLLFPIAIVVLAFIKSLTRIELGFATLITILCIALIASFSHALIALKWQLIQTRFGSCFKSENPKMFNSLVALSFVTSILLSFVLYFLIMYV